MNNQKGLSTLEVIISVGFLFGLVIVASNILEKQQKQMINAIQGIEITSSVNKIRSILADRLSCTNSFENKQIGSNDIKSIKKVTTFPNSTDIEIIDSYPLFRYGKVAFGPHKLKIINYELEEQDELEEEKNLQKSLNLIITFDKGISKTNKENVETREIKLYASTDALGRIESCSLSKNSTQQNIISNNKGVLIKESGSVTLGNNLVGSRLSIHKGIQFVENEHSDCEKDDSGMIFLKKGELYICHKTGSYQISGRTVRGL